MNGKLAHSISEACALAGVGRTTIYQAISAGRLHGFRSSFRDWSAEQTAYASEVVEKALAHAIRNEVEAAYRRGDLLDKRRQLLRAWEGYVAQPSPSKDKIVPLRAS